ncbi:MAG: ABC transporter substrate-binding protein [Bacteroidia bacterium]|nr:ABC transporter substrate-binding protein [Bacteroidia bacterium]
MQYTDQLERTIILNDPPQRIISLVPSITELLSYFKLDNEVVGITKFCIHPDKWFRTKARIGGTKNLNISSILDLSPDLIIANKEENIKEQIEELAKNNKVWISDVNDINDALELIDSLGSITSKSTVAKELSSKIKLGISSLKEESLTNRSKSSVAYLIWNEPMMAVAKDTFIDSIITEAGYTNAFADQRRYPEISIADLKNRSVDLLFLSSEPYPFEEKHLALFQSELPDIRVVLVDGTYFSWYGSRLLDATKYLKKLKHRYP